ncbi:hypothetical protein AG1IA_01883 [Rhizoctonia solani AG-1 IA]|uniref:Uncharacterized protein n=1 Tax=Thanatephorus cucumeris (strain AG1-IA) TaxID=983506 RepID=L8X4P8_THACA|nr:hypothetical protein AG1IA_01883 [Rhizoctonia solani AG-1 IA]
MEVRVKRPVVVRLWRPEITKLIQTPRSFTTYNERTMLNPPKPISSASYPIKHYELRPRLTCTSGFVLWPRIDNTCQSSGTYEQRGKSHKVYQTLETTYTRLSSANRFSLPFSLFVRSRDLENNTTLHDLPKTTACFSLDK